MPGPGCLRRRFHRESGARPERCVASMFAGLALHISPYLLRFAQEAAWREDNRRVPNGEQVQRVAKLALGKGKSVDWCGLGI